MEIVKEKNEFKAYGHFDEIDFASVVAERFQISVNPDKVEKTWEARRFQRGESFYQRCNCDDPGAKPITVIEV